LSQHEIVTLVTVMQNSIISDSYSSAWTVRNDMNKAGFTDIAVALALKLLRYKDMVIARELTDDRGESFTVFAVTRKGEDWLIANQDRLVLKQEPPKEALPF
jgi:hypothetical protein